jgi:hypothetical protein
MNTRQTIEVLKRRIKSMALLLGASLTVRTRAFGDGPDRAAVLRSLNDVRAYFGERAPDVITRGRPPSTFCNRANAKFVLEIGPN